MGLLGHVVVLFLRDTMTKESSYGETEERRQ